MDHRIKDDVETPECFKRIHELLNGTTMHPNSPSLDTAIKEPDQITKQQTSFPFEMDEFQVEMQRLQSEIDSLNAYNRNLERDNAEMTHVVSENQELRSKLDALTKKMEAKDTESHSSGASGRNLPELAYIGVQLQSLKDDTNAIITENRILRESINDFKAHTKVFSDNQATFSELQRKLTSEQRINEQLTEKLSESSNALEQITELSQRLRSRNQNTEKELEELRAKLDAAEKDRDWHRKQHTEILEVRNTTKAARESDDQYLMQENTRLKQENSNLAKQLRRNLRDIADFITHLDLAAEEVRVYTCSHKTFKEITPNSDKSTRIKPMEMIAHEMYKHWVDDRGFQEGYEATRKAICNHHNAHEKAGHRNGDNTETVRSTLSGLDQKRAIAKLLWKLKP